VRIDPAGTGTLTTGARATVAWRAEFTDEGVRWKVWSRPTMQPGLIRLEFESETGERRACDVLGFEERPWTDVDPRTLRMLVRAADAAPSPEDRG